jgi:2-polyprenyl-3-methyl-5-hydroxy-6-metoxy-1,4-benzoquinol methylase
MFDVGSIYDVDKTSKNQEFDVVVVRGVLHHLDYPKRAIKTLGRVFDKVIIFEPNGLNPILKVIEQFSPYHRKHRERSFSPSTLDRWFRNAGYEKRESKVFSIIPFWERKLLEF